MVDKRGNKRRERSGIQSVLLVAQTSSAIKFPVISPAKHVYEGLEAWMQPFLEMSQLVGQAPGDRMQDVH
jgi:hypothetical protein